MAVLEDKVDSEKCNDVSNIREGYMFVQSNSVWRPWSMKAKYFILTTECLYCFKRRGDLESIPCYVIPLDSAAVTIDEERRGIRKRYYIRLTSKRKTFNLFCFMSEVLILYFALSELLVNNVALALVTTPSWYGRIRHTLAVAGLNFNIADLKIIMKTFWSATMDHRQIFIPNQCMMWLMKLATAPVLAVTPGLDFVLLIVRLF